MQETKTNKETKKKQHGGRAGGARRQGTFSLGALGGQADASCMWGHRYAMFNIWKHHSYPSSWMYLPISHHYASGEWWGTDLPSRNSQEMSHIDTVKRDFFTWNAPVTDPWTTTCNDLPSIHWATQPMGGWGGLIKNLSHGGGRQYLSSTFVDQTASQNGFPMRKAGRADGTH